MLLPGFSLYYKLRKRRPLFTRYSLYTLTSNSNFSSEKAKRELGYRVRPFKETVRDALKWLAAEGKINIAVE
jgi:dihydroflavonol-4-reductase